MTKFLKMENQQISKWVKGPPTLTKKIVISGEGKIITAAKMIYFLEENLKICSLSNNFKNLYFSFLAIYVSVMVLVITFMDNYIILLVVFKIIWTLFVWVNMRDLYTTGKIYGHVQRKLKSDILY